jgi:hypothetical protein
MAAGDIIFSQDYNIECEVEQLDGSKQRAVHIAATSPLDVSIQDQSTELISVFLGNMIDTVTVLSNTAKDDVSVDLETTGATPLIGDFICLQEDTKITQSEVTSVANIVGNQYTLGISVPLDYAYTTDSGCMLLDVDMDKNGSITPIDFQVRPKAGTRWDITRMMTSMVMSSSGDDGLFGNIAALTDGVYFRKENSDETNNLFNAKENSDFAIEGYDLTYVLRSGGQGSHGMRSRITWGGQNKQGVVIRLDGNTNDAFVAVVRDNLTGINKFRVKVQGHVVED